MSDAQATPYEQLGGEAATVALAERFYDAMERSEPALTALHQRTPDGRISAEVRHNFGRFLCFWLGGPTDYLELRGHPRLRMRHAPFAVDTAMADAWLRCMTQAMDEGGITGGVRAWLDHRFHDVTRFLRNTPDPES